MAKDKSKVPDLGKADQDEAKLKENNSQEKEEETSKPRFVTVETSEEKPSEDTKEEIKINTQDKDKTGEEKSETELKPPKTDIKVTPSFSLLDSDKNRSEEQETETVKAEKPETGPETKTEEPLTPKITLGSTPKINDPSKEEGVFKAEGSESQKEVKKWLNETPITEDSGIQESKGVGKKIIIIVVIIMLIAGAIGGGFYYYKTNMDVQPEPEDNTNQIVVRDVDEPEPTATPTPEVEEVVDLTEFSVSVLNGSGVPGEAGKVNDMLVEAGFNEADTGNAESYDYGSTQISLKESVPESVFDTISAALSESYDVSSVPAELDDDSTYDIIVIVGSDEPEAEPTATPTPEELEE
ncbi:LytR C-terminal domain-containing protein [Candidatus Woesebacteria bacterium]|nr:LytR C-terminal domain-containing protein [Candidatus Woesebacteria bacterium]